MGNPRIDMPEINMRARRTVHVESCQMQKRYADVCHLDVTCGYQTAAKLKAAFGRMNLQA